MLYSATSQTYEKTKSEGQDSRLDTRKVFSGDYWDEFGLLGGPEVGRILVLGAGYGACVRPLLAASPNARITLVDTDEAALKRCKEIHKKHFPTIRVDIAHADAKDIHGTNGWFDLIWVDLYTDTGYADCLQDAAFFPRLYKMLSPRGMLAMNVFTTPTHFSEMRVSQAENIATRLIGTAFPLVSRFPFRRNVTLVGHKIRQIFGRSFAKLTQVDQLTYDILRLRAENRLTPVEVGGATKKLPTFLEINQEMTENWREVKGVVDPAQLTAELHSQSLTAREMSERVQSLQGMRYALPVMVGALSDGKDHLAQTFVQYLIEYGRKEAATRPLKFIHYFLPQLASILGRGEFDSKTVFLAERLVNLLKPGSAHA